LTNSIFLGGGGLHDKLVERAEKIGFDDFGYDDFPVVFWDLFGKQGHPVRTTITEMGPLLLAQLLDLNETQEGVLNIAFKIADDEGLLLLDLKDLRAILSHIGENFGEPALKLSDMIHTKRGRGRINILAADKLMQSPKLYATFLLWLLSELFEEAV